MGFMGRESKSEYMYMYCCLDTNSCLTLCDPLECSLPSVHGMRFPMQEYRSGLPFPSSGDFPDPWIESMSPAPPALEGGFFTTEPPGKPVNMYVYN